VSDTPDTDAVKRALRALATAPAPGRTAPSTDVGSVVRSADAATIVEATGAIEDVGTAAAFVRDGGLGRLRGAAERAERAGRRNSAREAQRVLATVGRYRRAAANEAEEHG
jgi:hypothetical protein